MNTAQTKPATQVADDFHNWRAIAPCAGIDPEVFFDKAEEDPDVAAFAKSVCKGCPFAQKCLDTSMLADEEYGIWGGMTPEERASYRPMWERIQGGRSAIRAKRNDNGILIHDPSIDRRYSARLKAAQECRKRVLAGGQFHRREDYLAVLELIIYHPTEDSGTLARRVGLSKTWFNTMKREVYHMFGITEVYQGEIA